MEKIAPAPIAQPKTNTHRDEKPKREFFAGDLVKHSTYGTGRVTKGTIAFPGRKFVEVDFGGHFGKKMLDVNSERLEKTPNLVPPALAASVPQFKSASSPIKTKRQWVNEGIAHNRARRYTEALDAYEHALKLDSRYAEAWNSKGITLENLSRYTEALDAYERALYWDPNNADVWKNKGDVLMKLRRSGDAKRAYQKALQLGQKR